MTDRILDGDWTVPESRGDVLYSFPLPRKANAFQVRDTWAGVLAEYYVKTEIAKTDGADEPRHPLYPDALLVSEERPRIGRANTMSFQRVWRNVPAQWIDEGPQVAYEFPGVWLKEGVFSNFRIPDGLEEGSRHPEIMLVTSQVQHDYYVTEDPSTITRLQPFQVLSPGGQPREYCNADTTPTATAYMASVTAADLITIEESQILRYAGNIWARRTTRVKAR